MQTHTTAPPPSRRMITPAMPKLGRTDGSIAAPSPHMLAFARMSAPIWADRMAWRIKAALADETPPEIEALIRKRTA